ncbi:hypothetical protein QFC20_003759 [Naganishia adeliensis]|uniref:Uncharacterized protein n=1 Tax=Naganishia adeliensis TaxID=92952 RepID=A0ACC2W7P4_9TREE|nr:hypothetical protein QFC20_003759 [Naganishia adeliensis]
MTSQHVGPFEYEQVGHLRVRDLGRLLPLQETVTAQQKEYGIVRPSVPHPVDLETRLSKALPPLPETGSTLEDILNDMCEQASYYTPRTPTSTSPSSLAGSPPSSIRNSVGSTMEDVLWTDIYEQASYYTPRTPTSTSPSSLAGSPPSSIRNSIGSTLEDVPWTFYAQPSVYTPPTPTSTRPSTLVGSSPTTPPLASPPQKSCPHGTTMCYDCMRHDLVYRDELALWGCQRNKAIYWAHQQARAEEASRPAKKKNWLCRQFGWGQNEK